MIFNIVSLFVIHFLKF